MPKIQIYSKKVYAIKISLRCEKAWNYLILHKVNAVNLLREGGEIAVINKANDFYYKEKTNKEYPNYPDWLFD
jgi:hypothetical protein